MIAPGAGNLGRWRVADQVILGLDIGTTSVKAGVIGAGRIGAGVMGAGFAQSYATRRPQAGWAEQDPADWLRLTHAALAQLVPTLQRGTEFAAIGMTSQVNTHVFVDAHGTPLLPAMTWQDGRAQAEAAELDAQISPAQKVAWWGAPLPVDASHPLPRMLWVQRHLPAIWEQTRWVMLPKDYVLLHLTGEAASDALSNYGLVDQHQSHIPELINLVPGAAARLPALVGVTEVAGRMRDGGPLPGCPVACGTMDAWAGLLGCGGARAGTQIYLSGTSEILGISSPHVTPTPGVVVFPEQSGVRLHAAPTQSGGEAALWLADVLGQPVAALSGMVADQPRSPATPLFLPQLEGERAPLWDASLRAAFLGLSRKTGAADLVRAVFEGVALSARHARGPLRLSAGVSGEVMLCGGGGFASGHWAQIRADVLGCTLQPLEGSEPGVLGAALIAAVAIGHHSGLEAAWAANARYGAPIVPDQTRRALYDDLFGIYTEAIAQSDQITKRLARL